MSSATRAADATAEMLRAVLTGVEAQRVALAGSGEALA